jgi:uncharacterized membrane protein YqhA
MVFFEMKIVTFLLLFAVAMICFTYKQGKTYKYRSGLMALLIALAGAIVPAVGIGILIVAFYFQEKIPKEERWISSDLSYHLDLDRFKGYLILVIVLISAMFVVNAFFSPVSCEEKKELVGEKTLLAIDQSSYLSGSYFFLVGSISDEDYYVYRYKDGDGFRNDMISKFGILIVEDPTMKEYGKMLVYNKYSIPKPKNVWEEIWTFFTPFKGYGFGSNEIQIRIPIGTVKNTFNV